MSFVYLASVSIAENMNTADIISTMSRNVRRWWERAFMLSWIQNYHRRVIS